LGAVASLLPTRSEQELIATFLDRETAKIDALVAEQQRLIEFLKEKRQAVISHAVTKGLDPTAKMKPSGIEWLGDVPAHWEVRRLRQVAEIRTGVAKGKDLGGVETVEIPYLRVANVQDGFVLLDDVATMPVPQSDVARLSLRLGDVLMNEGGDFDKLGRGCVWQGQIDPCITQNHVFAVRPHAAASEWVSMFTCSQSAQFFFMTMAKQSTNLASISSSNLMELPLPVPSRDEQERIVRAVDGMKLESDRLVAEAERAITLLQERRTALISAAVTGQIDVTQLANARA
jgi:type I restriction enzyme S subunit